ncbi:MAG: hypothetical protein VX272_06345, partial [Planctomycetota bacterium]|nr:hypothetical protein [Planctomycetota bacterium]
FDGPASTAKIRVEGFGSSTWKVPLADVSVEIQAVGTGEAGAWTATTSKDGGFSVETGASNALLYVAVAAVEDRKLFTGAFAEKASGPIELFAYPISDDSERVRSTTKIYHTVQKVDGAHLLKVQLHVELVNGSDTLYVGKKLQDGTSEVFRIPLPAGARLITNKGPVPGMKMRISRDGKFLVIDEPLVGLADLAASQQLGNVKGWSVEYMIPASDLFTMVYPQPLTPMGRAEGRPPGFLVYVQEEEMRIDPVLSPLQKLTTLKEGPLGGTPRSFDVYAISADSRRAPGDPVPVPIDISDVAVGEVSEKALFWHGGTLSIILLSILAGLAFNRKKGLSVSIDGAAGGDLYSVLDQIASLDELSASGSITPETYNAQRAVLVELAAGELEQSPSPEASAVPAPAIPSAARGLISRIAELDAEPEATVETTQERAHLLESLYKSLRDKRGG